MKVNINVTVDIDPGAWKVFTSLDTSPLSANEIRQQVKLHAKHSLMEEFSDMGVMAHKG